MFDFTSEFYDGDFDLAIFGLGFESRSTSSFLRYKKRVKLAKIIGYHTNTDKFSYRKNKTIFESKTNDIYEISDADLKSLINDIFESGTFSPSLNILIDITVMSRHRLATIIYESIRLAPKGSTLSIVYSLSKYISPPNEVSPVKKVCEICDELSGTLGNLSLPTSVVLGLGYEKGKALGISNYLDSWRDYIAIPKSPIKEFEEAVMKNNSDLVAQMSDQRMFYYHVDNPYKTYLDFRSLILSLKQFSRPHLIPLGPKILAAICVLIGIEFQSEVAVWRVSSEYEEEPIDRPPSEYEFRFTIEL